MLRSRGNRLPSERLVLSLSFCRVYCLSLSRTPSVSPLSPRRLARLSAPRTSPIHPLTLSFPSSLSLRLHRHSASARKRFARTSRRVFPSSLSRDPPSIVFIVPWILLPRDPSPVVGDRRYRCTHIHIHTRLHTRTRRCIVLAERTAPFFDRDSSPISFRSPL